MAAAALLAAPLAALAGEPECKLVRVAEWPIRWVGGVPIVDGAINGERANVMIHTAAYASLVTKDAAGRLRLAVSPKGNEVIAGRKGETSDVGVTRIEELRIGNTTARNLSVRVAVDEPLRGVDFILGADFLSRYDVELDFAGGFLRAFEPRRCVGGNLAYWDSRAHRVGLEEGQQINVPAKVNGRATTARLDTGYPHSQMQSSLAEKVGKDPGPLASGCRANARVDSIEIGNQVTRDAAIYVAPPPRLPRGFDPGPDLILGNDFLKRHRVLVSRSQATLYFSYLGGQVFTAPLLEPCDDRFPGKTGKDYLAALDAAIAANPRDARSLIQRGLRLAGEEPARALADLDAVIALEPENALAYLLRVDARRRVGDYAGALADSDAALKLGAANAGVYTIRGQLRRELNDPKGADEEYEQALRLDPLEAGALSVRGRLRYHEGRFEEAEKDFVKVTSLRTGGGDDIWLALARMRRGQDADAILEEGIARLKGEWPAPVMRYLQGRLEREALMASATGAEEKSRKRRVCEANYYVAARLLVEGKRDEAKPLLQKAVEGCPPTYREYDSARLDLKAYDAKPAS